MEKIATIVGARPQFIKASIVSEKLRKANINEIFIHTGQHYDYNMSDVFFKELEIKEPDYNLNIGSGNHGEMTGRMLIKLEEVLLSEIPDMVLVYGDTNSTLAGSLAASKLKIPVAHIEAGLRSFNKAMPEEINRVLTDHVSELLFAPTEIAVQNLLNEGITKNIHKVGDVMFDVALKKKEKIQGKEQAILNKYNLNRKEFILVTIHRADNTDIENNLKNIWEALCELAGSGKKIIFPVHPRTKKYLEQYKLLSPDTSKKIISVDPVSYNEMIILEDNAKVIVTDSGGMQKESYFFKTPAVIPRKETEWVELVDAGWNMLTGPDKEKIIEAAEWFYNTGIDKEWIAFYGEGDAAEKIVDIVIKSIK